MNINDIPDNPYILLTPGPLSTTKTVKTAMLRDWCTWDNDYNSVIQKLRSDLVSLATQQTDDYTAILMQGSGTFTVESVIGSVIPRTGKLLVLTNGAYGNRIVEIAKILGIDHIQQDSGEMHPIDIEKLKENMAANPAITHIAVIHCETTTGMLNNIETVGQIVKEHNKIFIVDAMSSFGGIPIDAAKLQIDFLISSSNKCIQGTPGFGFIIAKKTELAKCNGNARSLSLDIYDQWNTMEKGSGKWRYTSPTHVVMAFVQAMKELAEEGGITARHRRYSNNQKVLVNGMKTLGFEPLLAENLHSPIITSFLYPANAKFNFSYFYDELKKFGFVIYPGKISKTDTFRIGNIGDVYQKDIELLLEKIEKYVLSAKIK